MDRAAMKSNADSFRKRKSRHVPRSQRVGNTHLELMTGQIPTEQTMAQQKAYAFRIPIGPNGEVGVVNVPHEAMKVCPCGCDLFMPVSRVGYAKPGGVVGAEPIRLAYQVFVCLHCEREIEPGDESHADVARKKAEANGKGVLTDVQG